MNFPIKLNKDYRVEAWDSGYRLILTMENIGDITYVEYKKEKDADEVLSEIAHDLAVIRMAE